MLRDNTHHIEASAGFSPEADSMLIKVAQIGTWEKQIHTPHSWWDAYEKILKWREDASIEKERESSLREEKLERKKHAIITGDIYQRTVSIDEHLLMLLSTINHTMSEYNYLKNANLLSPKHSTSKVWKFSGFGTIMESSHITITWVHLVIVIFVMLLFHLLICRLYVQLTNASQLCEVHVHVLRILQTLHLTSSYMYTLFSVSHLWPLDYQHHNVRDEDNKITLWWFLPESSWLGYN